MDNKAMESQPLTIHDGMLELFDVSYDELKITHSNELESVKRSV